MNTKLSGVNMQAPLETFPKNGGLPIRLFLTPDLMPDSATMAQLEILSNVPGLAHYVAALPDLHRKSRNVSPTGTVVVTKNALVPRAVDTGINCGMRMIRTDIDAGQLPVSALDKLFGILMKTVPGHEHDHEILSRKDVEDIFIHGGQWSQKRFGLSDAELLCIEDGATMPTNTTDPDAILASLPEKVMKKAKRRFCTIGGGNHFLEMQEIVEVLDHRVAEKLELSKGNVVFMLHTCGRGVAGKMMRTYLPELEQKYGNRASMNGSPLWSLPADSEDGLKFSRAIAAVSNFGFANRMAITERVREAVRYVLNDTSLSLPLLYDCSHVSIKPERWNDEQLWVHRHGASRALPPSQIGDHPVFSTTGQPVPIPGSMGNDSYIGVASENAAGAFYSVNHGAGRVMDKPEAGAHFTGTQIEQEMHAKKIRLYRNGSDNIAEQAPSSFKDVAQVIKAMSAMTLANPVVRLRPVAVLKG